MELGTSKFNKSRKRKRLIKNRRRNQQKFEVRLAKRRKRFAACAVDDVNLYTMSANSYWENYKVAQDWQHRHNVAWWKSRCTALEYENEILRNKLRENVEVCPEDPQEEDEELSENLEFTVDDEMIKFLETSIRHKMELKQMRAEREFQEQSNQEDENLESSEVQFRNQIENSKLLYGSASSRIITMETALQASVDRYKDHSRPHYWPNIPLRP